MLRYVTITGADDRVDPSALADLSAEFPFVEWGILASKGREGTPRYPTREWMQRLDEAAARFETRSDVVFARRMNLSLHLCGEYAREALSGSGMFVPPTEFRRVQLNGWNPGANTPRSVDSRARSTSSSSCRCGTSSRSRGDRGGSRNPRRRA
jgi:hypothetical protein